MWGHPTPLGTVSALPHQFCAPDPGAPCGSIPSPCPWVGASSPPCSVRGGRCQSSKPTLNVPKMLGDKGTHWHEHLGACAPAAWRWSRARGGTETPKAGGCLQGAGAGSTLGCPYTPRTPTLGQRSLFSTASASQPPPAASAHPAPSARPLPERGRKSAGCHGASQGSPRPPGRAPAPRMEVAAGPP